MMKAMVIRSYGNADVFEISDVEIAPLKAGYVRVRVHATSVNPVDCKVRANGPAFGPELPGILHGDVAGVVEEIGGGVSEFATGDRVFGCAGGMKGEPGALAEFMNCDADLLAKMPRELGFREAAALPLVCLTAWEGLVDKAHIKAGQKVLVHAGTGGVGHVAIQIARAKGADVFATISGDNKATIAKTLGATPINYKTTSVAEYVDQHTGGSGFDVVFDTIGGDNIPRCWDAVKANGTVISCQSNSTHDMTPVHMKGIVHAGVLMLIPLISGQGRAHHGWIMQQIADMAEAGQISPVIDEMTFGLNQVAGAHQRWESGEAIGKIVINVSS